MLTKQTERVRKARAYAIEAHGDQKYGVDPYHVHLDEVAALVADFGEEAEETAYLHDVAEDTSRTLEDIEEHFGSRAKVLVKNVTDEPGVNRKERKARTNVKLAAVEEEYHLSLAVKAADRLANLRRSVRDKNEGLLKMYRREHAEFRAAAYRPGLAEHLWAEIEAIIAG